MTVAWPLLTAEGRDYGDVLEQIAREKLDAVVAHVEAADALPEKAVAVLAENGVFAAGLPADLDGADASLEDVALSVSIVAGALPALALTLADAHVGMTAAVGTDVVEELAARAAAGGPVCVLDTASRLVDHEGRSVEARRAEFVAEAAFGLVLTDGDALLVHGPTWNARAVGTPLRRTGLRGAPTAAVSLDLGPEVLTTSARSSADLRRLRLLLLGAAALGITAAAEGHARAYAAERKQFGQPLDAIAAVRTKLDSLGRDVAAQRASLLALCRRREEGESVDAPAFAASAVRTAVTGTLEMVQVLGGYGYLTDYPIERLVRDAVSLRAVAAGSGAVNTG